MAYVFGTLSGNAEIKNVIFSGVTVADPVSDVGLIFECLDNVNLENIQISNSIFTAGNGSATPLFNYAMDDVTISNIIVTECNIGATDGAYGVFYYCIGNVIIYNISSIRNKLVSVGNFACGIGDYLMNNCVFDIAVSQNNLLYANKGDVFGILDFLMDNSILSNVLVENCNLSCNASIFTTNISACLCWLDDNSQIENITVKNININGTESLSGCIGYVNNNPRISGVIDIDGINISITGPSWGTGRQIGGFACYLDGPNLLIDTSIITVKNVTIKSSDASRDVNYCGGFCGEIDGMLISNVYILNCSINGNDGSNAPFCGGILNSNISKCGVIGGGAQVIGEAAGFAPFVFNSTIERCFTVCTLNGFTIDGAGDGYGGFIGLAVNSIISNCYAVVNATIITDPMNTPICGGFIGINGGSTINNCYVAGSYTRFLEVALEGGFCGLQSGAINSCYWDTESTGLTTSNGGTGKTTAQMKVQDTFPEWDFNNIWFISPKYNSGYPVLKGSFYPSTGGGFIAATTVISIPGIQTNEAINISEQSATLKASLYDDGGIGCEVYFEYGISTVYGNKTSPLTKEQGEDIETFMVGLTPGVSYHFRAVAKNSAGIGYGSDKTFNTLSYEKVSFMGCDSILMFADEE